jgi:hypothetical protein
MVCQLQHSDLLSRDKAGRMAQSYATGDHVHVSIFSVENDNAKVKPGQQHLCVSVQVAVQQQAQGLACRAWQDESTAQAVAGQQPTHTAA